MGKMFKTVDRTWNPVTGCFHVCSYCYADILAKGRLRDSPRYREGFRNCSLHEKEFKRSFKPGETVFVVDMGDLWGEWVPEEWILRVLDHVAKFPATRFLMCTKNPQRYHEFVPRMGPNLRLGVTLETNRDYCVTQAPAPWERALEMKALKYPHKFVSIEPVMNFDLEVLPAWVKDIGPEVIEVGADNYQRHLPEPPAEKVVALLAELREFCPDVREKDGLQRLSIK